MRKGYMSFLTEAPIIGLDPHPAYAPDTAPEASGAHVWSRLYHLNTDRAELEREAREDLEARRDAYECGDMEDFDEETDIILPVTVSDDGLLTVMDPDGGFVLREYTPADLYGAFGMSCPEVLSNQRAEAWAVIRSQLDTLAGHLRTAGAESLETEYLLEDGIAGLQEILAVRLDGCEADLDIEAGLIPPLVSRSEFGRMILFPSGGDGTLRDHAEAVFESLAEMVLDDPDLVVDRIGIRLSADGILSVETESSAVRRWEPPVVETTRQDDSPDGP